MYDAALFYAGRAQQRSHVLERLSLSPAAFVLATCHRAESTDSREALRGIVEALAKIAGEHVVIFPMHPRTRKALAAHQLTGEPWTGARHRAGSRFSTWLRSSGTRG